MNPKNDQVNLQQSDFQSSRREFLFRAAMGAAVIGLPSWGTSLLAQNLKDGGAPVPEPHFPGRLHLFVWRNWELANADRMAKVLGTVEDTVLQLGNSMGLPPKPRLTSDQLRRIYITVIRQNWHVLSHEQLIELLGWDRAHYEYTLKEDDFLWSKLGLGVKPRCAKLLYQPPTPEMEKRAAEIKRRLHQQFGSALTEPGESPFHFVQELSDTRPMPCRDSHAKAAGQGEIDLSEWGLVPPEGSPAGSGAMLDQFREYLQVAFGCSTKILAADVGAKPSQVRFHLDPSIINTAESFAIRSEPGSVMVTATDLGGLRRAIYHLQDRMEERSGPFLAVGNWRFTRKLNPRYIYPYFALYGDPLMDEEIDPLPDGYLEKLGRKGVNGVWLQAVLRTLAPSAIFPEFGQGSETRLKNLRRFVQRAKNYGLKIYLYINEPRPLPRAFFEKHPEVRGTPYAVAAESAQEFAMCTSVPKVREWLAQSLAHVFSQVPDLGGIFTITMSENLTNCFAHGRAELCPNCSKREGWQVITELLQTYRNGISASNPAAEIVAWDWGWGWVPKGADPEKTISNLPKRVQLLSVSEWGKKYERGGVPLAVAEYSISVVGPGANALDHWAVARRNGIRNLAKVQFNNTWEISAVPYIPVPHLIQEHMENLIKEEVNGLMLSWTLGGYPSPNLDVAKEYYYTPVPSKDEVLRKVAVRRYGPEAASSILLAWETFSRAFKEFPYGVVSPYSIPTQHGPSNPLRLAATGYGAAMILFPYDDLKAWVGPYAPEIAQSQFEKMAALWENGLQNFRQALNQVPPHKLRQARKDHGVAEACWIHFRSVANQIQFYRLRDQSAAKPEDRTSVRARMAQLAGNEIELTKRLYRISRLDSTIGYEATNHYYYRPLDLAEKVLNCDQVIRSLKETKT